MEPLYFETGELEVAGTKITITQSSLKDRHYEEEIKTLNEMAPDGMARVPYRQKPVLAGNFSPALSSISKDALRGRAKLTASSLNGVITEYSLEIVGSPTDSQIFLSEVTPI